MEPRYSFTCRVHIFPLERFSIVSLCEYFDLFQNGIDDVTNDKFDVLFLTQSPFGVRYFDAETQQHSWESQ